MKCKCILRVRCPFTGSLPPLAYLLQNDALAALKKLEQPFKSPRHVLRSPLPLLSWKCTRSKTSNSLDSLHG